MSEETARKCNQCKHEKPLSEFGFTKANLRRTKSCNVCKDKANSKRKKKVYSSSRVLTALEIFQMLESGMSQKEIISQLVDPTQK